MPELLTDRDSESWTQSDDDIDEYTFDRNEIEEKNNLCYLRDNYGELSAKIGYDTRLPPNLDEEYTIGAINDISNDYTNGKYNSSDDCNFELFNEETNVIIIDNSDDEKRVNVLFSNAIYHVEDGKCILSIYDGKHNREELEDVYFSNTQVVRSRNTQWYIHVPIRQEDGTTVKTWIFADPGANSPCVKTSWAIKVFPNMIMKNRIPKVMLTPGGKIKPRYSLWMTFPAKKNTVLKVKMNLVNDLPVDVLADINMLEAFGYTFKDETPPIFRHDEKDDLQFDLKEDDNFISNRVEPNWFNCVTQMKLCQIESGVLQGNDTDKICLVDKIYDDNENIIYSNLNEKRKFEDTIVTEEEYDLNSVSGESTSTIVNLVRKVQIEEKIDINNINQSRIEKLDCNKYNVNNVVENLNDYNIEENYGCKIYQKCLLLMQREAFLATKEEIAKAKKTFKNERLKFPNYTYLKSYETKYGSKFSNLYQEVMKWLERNKNIFATHTYSRRTMYTEPARLGIKPEHRDKVMYCPQYPISAEKRIHMINYTLINEKNGFWYKIPRSQHGIPYLMVAKRNSNGVIVRYRPAFDARIVNQYCQLMQCVMPTLKDFQNLHHKGGLTTLADIKNFFDCIPLHWKDRKYAVCFTPMGIYCMLCMTYGFMNAAPEAQKRTNRLAYNQGNCLAYVDDITIKHPLEDGTAGVIESLDRLAAYCVKTNIQLNPKKFYPATDESESFGFKHSLTGTMVADSYKRKMLAVAKPQTMSEMRSFDGLCNYVNNHIYHNKRIMYWLNKLKEEVDPETKGKRLKWTKEANLSWEQLQFLLNQLPKLRHPTRDGLFCLIVDACNYGIGASLYQQQKNETTGELEWQLIDLWSKVMPKQLRHCHSMVHEAFAVVSACEHWQFYLIRRKFILSTDNMAVANVFGIGWKSLSPITQKQIIRLRSKINSFKFESYHLKGIKNVLADGLSRFTVKLIKDDKLKPMDQRRFPLELSAYYSDDTMNEKLSKEDKEIFDLAQIESAKLTALFGELKREKIQQMVNVMMVSDGYLVEPDDVEVYQPNKEGNKENRDRKYNIFCSHIDDGFNNMIMNYQNNGNYIERERMKRYIRDKEENLTRKNEESMSGYEIEEFTKAMVNVAVNLDGLIDDDCERLDKMLYSEYWQHLTELKCVNEAMEATAKVNAIDQEYDPRDEDEEYELESKEREPIRTRGRAKREREKAKSRLDDDDSIEDEMKFTRFNERFEDIREQMESHEDLMLELFGSRRNEEAMDFARYREFQESDNITAIAIKLFKIPNKREWKQEDKTTLYDHDDKLFFKLNNGELLIENNILKCWDYDPVKKSQVKKIVVPFFLRGKLMDYMHHNLMQHHFSYKYTKRNITSRFWWSTMLKDISVFCKQCISCQFTKGTPRRRAPLVSRPRPKPREHIFADLLGPIYQRYYVLVLVDYATGYSMLIPVEGCDAMTIAQAIIDYWIRIFGCFNYFESDWGSGFNSKLFKYLAKLLDFQHEFAEPRNHRSIGKVERVIGFLQTVINHYNLLLNKELTDDIDDIRAAWTRIRILLPFIQFAFNQRVMRITGISPNMGMFGTNLNDLSDVSRMTAKIDEFSKDDSLQRQDFELLRNIKDNIERMNWIAETNWKRVTWLSMKSYNNKYNITPAKINRNRKIFKTGNEVLYFIGDKQVARYKWREKWSGPWRVDKILNDSTIIIADPRNGDQKRVSIDRVKPFNRRNYVKYESIIHYDDEYIKYQKDLLETLSNYKVKTMNKKENIDYNTNKRNLK